MGDKCGEEEPVSVAASSLKPKACWLQTAAGVSAVRQSFFNAGDDTVGGCRAADATVSERPVVLGERLIVASEAAGWTRCRCRSNSCPMSRR